MNLYYKSKVLTTEMGYVGTDKLVKGQEIITFDTLYRKIITSKILTSSEIDDVKILDITLENDQVLSLSSDCCIYCSVHRNMKDKVENLALTKKKVVELGTNDKLAIYQNNQVNYVSVVNIVMTRKKGLYSVKTEIGTLICDGAILGER